MSEDLVKLVAQLKNEFAQLKKDIAGKRGIPGPTGPAGNIDSAVTQARDVAEQVAVVAAKKAVVYPFQNEVAKLRTEFAELKADFETLKEHVENEIVIHVLKTLEDYHVVDKDGRPYAGPYSAAALPKKSDEVKS
jgi:hypothetical protein